MGEKHTATVFLTLVLGDRAMELTVKVQFTHVPADPGCSPSYADGGSPPEPEHFEDVTVVGINMPGSESPLDLKQSKWLTDWIEENIDDDELMLVVNAGPDPDYLREEAEERRREEAAENRRARLNVLNHYDD